MCSFFRAKLANADDAPESLSILLSRASNENFRSGSLWIDKNSDGKCTALDLSSTEKNARGVRNCDLKMYAFCQFNSKFCLIKVLKIPNNYF